MMTVDRSARKTVGWPGIALACCAVAAGGCTSTGPTAPDDSAPALTSTPTRVIVDGKTLTLGAYLWRDFFPISPPDGRPMVAVLQVQTEDGAAVPATITGEMVWLVLGSEVWTGVPREERARQDAAPLYELVARDGPKWIPGAFVDVVVQLRERSGRVSRLRAPDQLVRSTF